MGRLAIFLIMLGATMGILALQAAAFERSPEFNSQVNFVVRQQAQLKSDPDALPDPATRLPYIRAMRRSLTTRNNFRLRRRLWRIRRGRCLYDAWAARPRQRRLSDSQRRAEILGAPDRYSRPGGSLTKHLFSRRHIHCVQCMDAEAQRRGEKRGEKLAFAVLFFSASLREICFSLEEPT